MKNFDNPFTQTEEESETDDSLFWFVLKMIAAIILLGAGSIMLFSCNNEKIAAKQFDRANRKSHVTVLGKCAEIASPIDSIHERIVFRQGKPVLIKDTIYAQDTLVINDTVFITKWRTTEKLKTDTLYTTKYTQLVNNAKVQEQAIIISNNDKKIASQKKALSITMWALIILSCYTLGRWVLRIWNIKLP